MSKKRPRVYISGPITKGDRNYNFYQASVLEKRLMLEGFAPLNPMRAIIVPHNWDEDLSHDLWLDCDLPWVEVADVVFRLLGDSVGADKECRYAELRGIPVVTCFNQLKEVTKKKESGEQDGWVR